jgi:cystathionine beta-lyase family protein involved in aluminum resistance
VPSKGSLAEFGVSYRQADFKDGKADLNAIKDVLNSEKIKVVFIQRSKSYFNPPTLSCKEIGEIVDTVKSVSPESIVIVDNCYGEFCETVEPTHYGADLVVGSLIKNAGGGMADSGGYIAGKRDLVELCAYRATTPGLGKEVGCTLGENRNMFMGLFNAPHVTGEAMKTAVFASALFEILGFGVTPRYDEERSDIIQAIKLLNEQNLCAFCQGIQSGSPVDAFVTPEPWDMPGYNDQVIMAAGAFTQGSSSELSADGPLRPPYTAFFQGGLTYESGKIGIMYSAEEMLSLG